MKKPIKKLTKKQGGGPMGEKKPALNKVTPAQSKVTGAKVGEQYRTTAIKTDAINTPIRQKLSNYATRGPEPKEYAKYQELTRASAKPVAMKRGGAMPKKQMGGITDADKFYGPNTPAIRVKSKSSDSVSIKKPSDSVSAKELSAREMLESYKKKIIKPSPLKEEPASRIKPNPLKKDERLFKKGGSMSKMTMMKKGGAMKVSTIKKKK